MGLSEPLLWYRSRFFGVNFMRYIGIGYNQQYGISLCLKTMIYLRHVKRKGFYSGIMSPLDILYSRKYHGIDEWGLKKSRQTLMNLSWVKYGKKTSMELHLKGFPILYHVFFRNLFMKRPFKRHGWCKRWGCQLKFGFPAKCESVWHCFEFRLGLMEFTAGVYCWMIFWRSEFWMPLRVFYNEDQNNFSKNFSRLWAIPELR